MDAAAQQSVAPIINNNNNKIIERNLCGYHDRLPGYQGMRACTGPDRFSYGAGPRFPSTARCPAFRLHFPPNNAFDDRVFICCSRRIAVFKRTRNKRFWTIDSSMAPVRVVKDRASITTSRPDKSAGSVPRFGRGGCRRGRWSRAKQRPGQRSCRPKSRVQVRQSSRSEWVET